MCEKQLKEVIRLGQRVVTGFGNKEVTGDFTGKIVIILPAKIRHFSCANDLW